MTGYNQLSPMHSLKILSILLVLFILKANGQEKNSPIIDKLFTITENYLPDDLLKTKSIVLIKVPENEDDHRRGNWKKLAKEIHGYIIARGIDPVWYFNFDDIYAGPDLSKSIANSLITREVENIIVFDKNDERSYDMYVTTFNKNEYFFEHGQKSAKIHAATTAQINRSLAMLIDRKDLIDENLMFLDSPEYYNQSSLIRGKRFQHYATDLKLDKLAVPGIKNTGNNIIPVNFAVNDNVKGKAFIADSSDVSPKLQSILKQYPYQYDFIRYNFEEQTIRKKGYPFVLLWLHDTAPNIKHLLKYPENDKRTKIADDPGHIKDGDLLVYKFYVKHIYTGDIYLGTTWDADTNWQKALQNHLALLNKNIKP